MNHIPHPHFNLKIRRQGETDAAARLDSLHGQAESTFHLPFTRAELKRFSSTMLIVSALLLMFLALVGCGPVKSPMPTTSLAASTATPDASAQEPILNPAFTLTPTQQPAPSKTPASTAIPILTPTDTRTPTPTSLSPTIAVLYTAIAPVQQTLAPAILVEIILDEKGALMALVPAGPFRMGSNEGAADEQPEHYVNLDAFYMDVYEVTNAAYAQCVSENACSAPSDEEYADPERAQYPVAQVSWDDATAFCTWRGARLPTEAEWEKAARGGLDGQAYPWGDMIPSCPRGTPSGVPNEAKYDDGVKCQFMGSEPVGSYAPNGYGLYDMAGNVWEWVNDRYQMDYYSAYPENGWPDNPAGPDQGNYRVLRGGSWDDVPGFLRAAERSKSSPSSRYVGSGFRCARSP